MFFRLEDVTKDVIADIENLLVNIRIIRWT